MSSTMRVTTILGGIAAFAALMTLRDEAHGVALKALLAAAAFAIGGLALHLARKAPAER
jgi:hypothetical protein